MENLFDRRTVQKFVDRIYKLSPGTQSQWGKMDVSQMLSHCQVTLKIASGEMKPKTNPLIRFLFGKRAKKQLVEEHDFQKHLPTFAEARISDKRNFEKEREKLIALIETYSTKGPAGLTKDPHPFFGKMTTEDWNTLQVKHLDHHLRQFGV